MPRGAIISPGVREIVFRVKEFFLKEKQLGGPIIPFAKVNERVAAATGISMHSISNITVEGRLAQALDTKIGTIKEPRKQRKDKIIMSDYDQGFLRMKIKEFNRMRKERPTVKKLYEALKEETDFKGSREIVRQYLKKHGFQYKKLKGRKTVLVEEEKAPVKADSEQGKQPETENTGQTEEPTNNLNEWVAKKLGPFLEEPSAAKACSLYQYRLPTTNDKKSDVRKWLTHHKIPFPPESTRSQLLDIVKINLQKPGNTVDAVMNILRHKKKMQTLPTVPGWGADDDGDDSYSKYLQLKKQLYTKGCLDEKTTAVEHNYSSNN